MPPRATTVLTIPGATSGFRPMCQLRTRVALSCRRAMFKLIRRVPARLECGISSGVLGSGRMNGPTSTLVPPSCMEAATTSPAPRSGISRRHINYLNMESIF